MLFRSFLLLRCESGELDAEIGNWWTTFYAGDVAERERLINSARDVQPSSQKKRPRRRGPRRAEGEGAGAPADAGSNAQAASGE